MSVIRFILSDLTWFSSNDFISPSWSVNTDIRETQGYFVFFFCYFYNPQVWAQRSDIRAVVKNLFISVIISLCKTNNPSRLSQWVLWDLIIFACLLMKLQHHLKHVDFSFCPDKGGIVNVLFWDAGYQLLMDTSTLFITALSLHLTSHCTGHREMIQLQWRSSNWHDLTWACLK